MVKPLETNKVKVTVTLFAASIVTTQLPVPEQAPDQPAKVESAEGEAVKVTEVPEAYVSECGREKELLGGLKLTVPVPVPALVTVRA